MSHTMSPSPNIEKWPEFCILGNISFPGSDNFGGSFTPFKWSRLATIPTGLSAVLVATRTLTFQRLALYLLLEVEITYHHI